MIHFCPHCEAAGRKAQHHIPGEHDNPECPDILCGKRASEALPPEADFRARVSMAVDRDRFKLFPAGEEVSVRVLLIVKSLMRIASTQMDLQEARDLLEPIDHHLAPVAELAAGEAKKRSPSDGPTDGQWEDYVKKCCDLIDDSGAGTGNSLYVTIENLVAKVRALEAERGGRPAGDDIKCAVGRLREFMDTPHDTLIIEKGEWVEAAWALIHHAEGR
jgi:hypothetical protein